MSRTEAACPTTHCTYHAGIAFRNDTDDALIEKWDAALQSLKDLPDLKDIYLVHPKTSGCTKVGKVRRMP